MSLRDLSWDSFRNMNLAEKGAHLFADGREEHILIAQQFSRERLDFLGDLTTKIRLIAKSDQGMDFLHSLLAHKSAMLYFSQPSTRTFLSFCSACQLLGLRYSNVRDTATSSEFKGESQEDSVRTFSSYFDMIIMRSEVGGLAERMAWLLANTERPVPIINAGSGKDQHPTQALLDIYTLQRSFESRGGIDGKTIVFVGDLARGRTVRSLSFLLSNYEGVKQCFVAPDHLQIGQDILDMLSSKGVEYSLSDDFEALIPEADAVYMTRVQDEWDERKGQSAEMDISNFCFEPRHLSVLKNDAIIMHPFPRRVEIPAEIDSDPRAMYWRQMRNGMWIRTAIIATIFKKDLAILNYYSDNLK